MLCLFPLLFVISEGFPSPLSSGWASYFLLRASGGHKALLSVLVPRRGAAPLGHRGPLRREECQGSVQQTALCSILPSRGCGEGLQQRGYSPECSGNGQACQMVLGPWTIQDTPSPQTKKAIQRGPPGRRYIPPSLWEWQGNGNQKVERVAHFGGPPELGLVWRSVWAFVCLPNKNKPTL